MIKLGESMENFEDKEWFLLKELSMRIVSGLTPSVDKIKKQCEFVIAEIEEIEKSLKAAESGIQINEFSKASAFFPSTLHSLLLIYSERVKPLNSPSATTLSPSL